MTIPQALDGRRALVTGGTTGIGLATVRRLATMGATVAVNHLPDDVSAAAVVDGLRNDESLPVFSFPGDVGDPAAETMIAEAIERLGGLDYLINNAGTPGTSRPIELADFEAMTEEFWNRILSVNLKGPFRCVRAAQNALRASRGAIVNTASVAGLGMRGSSIAYAASKAALINMTRNLAKAFAPDVRVNAVAPGLIETPWTAAWPDERKARTRESTLLGRLGRPDEVAEVIVFLATGASYITGETIVVNGGTQG